MRFFCSLILSLLLGAGYAAETAPQPQQAAPQAQPVQADASSIAPVPSETLAMLERSLAREESRNARLQQMIVAQEKESDVKLTDLEHRFREAFLSIVSLDNMNFFALTYSCNRIAQLHTECSGGNFPFYLTRKRMEMAVQRYTYLYQALDVLNHNSDLLAPEELPRLQRALETSKKLADDYKAMLNGLNNEQERFTLVAQFVSALDRYANGATVEKYALISSDSATLEITDLVQNQLKNGGKPVESAGGTEKQAEKDAAADAVAAGENPDVTAEIVKAYAINADLDKLSLEEEFKTEGRLASRIITELWDPANPFRKLSYNASYWSLWQYVPLAFTNNYLKSTDPEFAGALGHALLFLLISAVLSVILSALLCRCILHRRRGALSAARVHAIGIALSVLFTGMALWGYILTCETDAYLDNNLSFLANYLMLSVFLFGSLSIRLRSKYVSSGTRLFLPFFVLNLLLITYCIMRCPTFLVRMTSPVVFILCGLWMCRSLLRRMDKLRITARIIAVMSILFMFVGSVFCLEGYYYLVILLELCWFVLVTNVLLLSTISKVGKLVSRRISGNPRFGRYRYYISLWLDLLVAQMVQPLIFLGLIWYGLRWPAQGFNLGQFLSSWMGTPYHFGGVIRTISADNVILIVTVGIALNCLLHITAQTVKIVNGADGGRSATWLTLGSMLAWGSFVIFALNLLNADYNSILVVMGGMSVGVGLGLKDNIDNLIGGISLMLGRLRPGDIVECDGVRGNVVNIGYRTTSLETLDGSVIVFQNSQLFAQNFRNLTRNHQYERCIVAIGVTYGTDVDRARRLILKALRGIPGLTSQHPSAVLLDNFGDSSVNLSIVVWVPVSTKQVTLSRVREAVYRTFNEHGIEIPFPQQDLYIKPLPGAEVPQELKVES